MQLARAVTRRIGAASQPRRALFSFSGSGEGGSAEPAPGAAAGGAGGGEAEDVAKLKAEVTRLEAALKEEKDAKLRAMADTANSIRQKNKQVDDARVFAITKFAKDMLEVSDNLTRAMAAVKATDAAPDSPLFTLLEGIKAVDLQLYKVMAAHGVSRTDALGKPFDANLHQALFEVPTPESAPGTVVQEIQPGYTINGRILRPSSVGVARKP